ncbi:MAG: hypothetical protein D4R81_00745 [Nitrospiraceae bacterium]|nr:MAG: hypothetical protein D4R81_00745 [Nitrospiraceae bacterium]
MNKFLAIGAVAIFSFMVAGTALAQERSVLQEGYTGGGTGLIGSGPGGGIDNGWMRELLSHPETVYGRLWGKDIAGSKVYVETGGGALVTLKLTAETNMENIKAIGVGNDIEVQVKRNYRRLGSGAFASEVPEGDAIALNATVIRAAVNPSALTPQAGFEPDTDRGINTNNASSFGGAGGQCWQCYEGQAASYGKK